MSAEKVKTKFPLVLLIPILLLIGCGLLTALLLYLALSNGAFDKLTIDVENATTQPLEKVTLEDGAGQIIVALGTIPPGGHASQSFHFGRDIGPAFFFARQPGRLVSGHFGYLFTDDGPYHHTVTVYSDQLHLHRTNNDDPWDADIPPLEPPVLGLAPPEK